MKGKLLDRQKLKEERQNAKLSIEAFAEAAEIGVSALSKYERGEREPSYKSLVKIAKALKLSPQDLLLESPSVFSLGGIQISIDSVKAFELSQRIHCDEIIDSYSKFYGFIMTECGPSWDNIADKMSSGRGTQHLKIEKNIRAKKNEETEVYKYTKKNCCKKADFKRVKDILEELNTWNDDTQEIEAVTDSKYGLRWLSQFSPRICEIARLMMTEKITHNSCYDLQILNDVISFFNTFPAMYMQLSEAEPSSPDDRYTQKERDMNVQGIRRKWETTPPLNQFIVSDMLYFAFIHRQGYKAYRTAQRYKCLPTELKNIIMAYIMDKATSEQRQQFDSIFEILRQRKEDKQADEWDWERLQEALYSRDEALSNFDNCKTANTNMLMLFHHLLIYYELEGQGTMKNLIPALDILLEGQQLIKRNK